MDLRITLKDCDEHDAGDLIRHLEEQGLLATFEVGTARSRRGWAPFTPEREETL